MARLALLTALVLLATATPAAATFPGRNGPLAYNQAVGGGGVPETDRADLMLQRTRTARPRPIADCERIDGVPSGGDCTATSFHSLSFSADGRWIAFDAGARIGMIPATGGQVTLLPAATADDGDPVFSPNGKRIVFTGANDRGGTDLWVRAADGSGPAHLLINDAAQPAISFRDALAYTRGDNVYIRPPGGVRRHLVTSGVSPDWSPDGKRLAIIRPLPSLTFDDPIGRIYTVRRNGRGLTAVGRQRYASNPAWSPDGRLIAYDGFDLGVYVKRIGSAAPAREWAPTQIGSEGAFVTSSFPAWRPLRVRR